MRGLPALAFVLVVLALALSHLPPGPALAAPGADEAGLAAPTSAAAGSMCRPARAACAETDAAARLLQIAAEGEAGAGAAEDHDSCLERCDTVHVKCKRECTWKHCVQLCDSKYYDCRDKCDEAHDE